MKVCLDDPSVMPVVVSIENIDHLRKLGVLDRLVSKWPIGNTGIEEAGLSSVKSFINNTLDRSAAPIKAFEHDTTGDYKRGKTDFVNILGEWVRPYLSFLAGGLDDPYAK